jgi:SpoVK/Ycf46/Vps4 family AAA+-type ATPase
MIDHSDTTSLAVSANSTRYFIAPPVDDEIEEILKRSLAKINRRSAITIDVSRSQLAAIVGNLRGLSRWQIEQAVAATVADDRTFNADDLMTVIRAKRQILQAAGVLEFVDTPASMDEIGGLSRLKKWLHQRKDAMREDAREMGLSPPRGVMLLGVQGAGKSLAAKAIAAAWKRPLMKLDPSVLYDRYVGESERRLREALAQAEAMSPVILWIDEIEKGFAGAASTSNDGGLSRRMFGTLLNWMQEHSSPVFLVATANDIEALPPELLRKGRFDEIFFVDLPGDEARRKILAIHLKKRKQDPAAFDLALLAERCEGYSGAEIEQAVISALHGVYAGRARQAAASLTTERLLEAILASPPLSVTMAEKINALREWARGRCVPAD